MALSVSNIGDVMQREETLNIGGIENATPKDAWAISARPQIQQLMAGSADNHVAAMTLLIPWMDQVYTLESGDSSKGKTRQVVARFSPRRTAMNWVA